MNRKTLKDVLSGVPTLDEAERDTLTTRLLQGAELDEVAGGERGYSSSGGGTHSQTHGDYTQSGGTYSQATVGGSFNQQGGVATGIADEIQTIE